MAIRIRPRLDSDIERLVPILQRVYAQDGYPVEGVDNARELIAGSSSRPLVAWVAEQSEHDEGGAQERDDHDEGSAQLAGHVAVNAASSADVSVALWRVLHPDEGNSDETADGRPHLATVGKLFVDPARRGRGAASRLIARAAEWADAHVVRLVLFVLEKDHAARGLYAHLGWVQYGHTTYRWYEGGDTGPQQQMEAICFVRAPAKR